MQSVFLALLFFQSNDLLDGTDRFTQARERAAKDGIPLVVGVRCDPPRPTLLHQPWARVKVLSLEGFDRPTVIVYVKRGQWFEWRASLPVGATASQVADALEGRAKPLAIPFEPRIADANMLAASSWLEGMQTFERANNTQAIAERRHLPERFFRDVIDLVPRSSLDRKWQVSGGMEGVHGWKSIVFKNDCQPEERIGTISVLNSAGFFQDGRGWRREYPNGAKFADVLLNNEGLVFEVRTAEKIEGEWHRRVAFRDEARFPQGYKAVSLKKCVECHSQAGTGGYGVGLVPGGDTVISEPFSKLERE